MINGPSYHNRTSAYFWESRYANVSTSALLVSASRTTWDSSTPVFLFEIDGNIGPFTSNARSLGSSSRLWASTYSFLFRAGVDSSASPAFSWESDSDTGLFNPTTNSVGVSAGGSEIVRVNPTGVGIGATIVFPLNVGRIESSAVSGATQIAIDAQITDTSTTSTTTTTTLAGIRSLYQKTGGSTRSTYQSSTGFFQSRISGGVETYLPNVCSRIESPSGGSITTAYHFLADADYTDKGGSITNLAGFVMLNPNRSTTTLFGVYLYDFTAASTFTAGFYSLLNTASNKWAIYLAGTASSYFAGNVGLAITPIEKLDVLGQTLFRQASGTLDGLDSNVVSFTYGTREYLFSFIGSGHCTLLRSINDKTIVNYDRLNGTLASPASVANGDLIVQMMVSGRNPSGSHTQREFLGVTVEGSPSGTTVNYSLALMAGLVTVTSNGNLNVTAGTLTVSSSTLVSNLNAQYWNGLDERTLTASLRGNVNISGGGTITVDSSGNILWSQRLVVIDNGRGTFFSTTGFYDIICPASGTVTGVGGASNQTATASGIPFSTSWVALYYILPIGSNNTSISANFRLVSYTSDLEVPSNWILIALRNGDTGVVYFCTGVQLKNGTSYVSSNPGPYGNGSVNLLAKWTAANTIGNSVISDDGTNVAVNGSVISGTKLYVYGTLVADNNVALGGHALTTTTGSGTTLNAGLIAAIANTTDGAGSTGSAASSWSFIQGLTHGLSPHDGAASIPGPFQNNLLAWWTYRGGYFSSTASSGSVVITDAARVFGPVKTEWDYGRRQWASITNNTGSTNTVAFEFTESLTLASESCLVYAYTVHHVLFPYVVFRSVGVLPSNIKVEIQAGSSTGSSSYVTIFDATPAWIKTGTWRGPAWAFSNGSHAVFKVKYTFTFPTSSTAYNVYEVGLASNMGIPGSIAYTSSYRANQFYYDQYFSNSIYLNNGLSNLVYFYPNGVDAPTFTTRSVGTKVVLYPNISGSTVDYAIGVAASTLWMSVTSTSSTMVFYYGTSKGFEFSGSGALTLYGLSSTGLIINTRGSGVSIVGQQLYSPSVGELRWFNHNTGADMMVLTNGSWLGVGITVPQGTIHSAGRIHWNEINANPSASDLTSGSNVKDRMAVYMKSDRFVIAYNNGGTPTFIYIDFDGSSTTWVHTTTPP